MADSVSAGTVVTSQEQVQPLTVNPPVTSVAIETPLAPMGDNLNIDLPLLEEEIQQAEVLNSTTHSERSNRSSKSISEDVLLEIREMGSEMRAMNHNIALMLQAHLSDRERMSKLEGRQNVSEKSINTSSGFTLMPYMYD
jgi:hypothetical protein